MEVLSLNLYDKDNQKLKDITVAQLKGYKLVVWSEKKHQHFIG